MGQSPQYPECVTDTAVRQLAVDGTVTTYP